MVNSNEFSERLKNIMEYYQITPTSFADTIGVQRSSISHLLSGRNKPSLDFVVKVLDTYKEIELYWLLKGNGTFPKIPKIETEAKTTPKEQTKMDFTPTSLLEQDVERSIDAMQNKQASSATKEIESITIFFKDGTFKNYIQ